MNESLLSRRRLLLSALATVALPAWAAPARPRVDVWKDPNCGCCGDWVKHLEAEGFAVRVFATGADAARRRLGLPDAYASCHTTYTGDTCNSCSWEHIAYGREYIGRPGLMSSSTNTD